MALASPPPRVPLVTLQWGGGGCRAPCPSQLCCRVTLAGPSHGGPAAGWPVGATDGEMLRGTSPLRCDTAAGLMLPGCPPTLGCRRPHESLSPQRGLSPQPCSAGSLPWSPALQDTAGLQAAGRQQGGQHSPGELCPLGTRWRSLPECPCHGLRHGVGWLVPSPALQSRLLVVAPFSRGRGTGAGHAGSCPCTHWGPGTGRCRTEAAGPRVPAALGQGWGRAGTRG